MARIDIDLERSQPLAGVALDHSQSAPRRRHFLLNALEFASLTFGVFLVGKNASAEAGQDNPIPQPAIADPAHYVERAFALRRLAAERGDQAYGAVIVRENAIVGQAPSRVVVSRDPTAHAEMEAIRDATRRLGIRDLSDCVMYSSSKPCPMCEAAAYWANVEQLVYGAKAIVGGPPRLTGC